MSPNKKGVSPTATVDPPKQSIRPDSTPARSENKVLLVHHPDGYLEIYGTSRLAVKLVSLPDHDPGDYLQEIASEAWLRRKLARDWREVFDGPKLWAGRPETISHSEHLANDLDQSLIRIIGQALKDAKGDQEEVVAL